MKKILNIFILLSLAVAFTDCKKKKKKSCPENINPGCVCTTQYEPVCGCNEKTYGNSCEAECSGITDYTAGACK